MPIEVTFLQHDGSHRRKQITSKYVDAALALYGRGVSDWSPAELAEQMDDAAGSRSVRTAVYDLHVDGLFQKTVAGRFRVNPAVLEGRVVVSREVAAKRGLGDESAGLSAPVVALTVAQQDAVRTLISDVLRQAPGLADPYLASLPAALVPQGAAS